MREIIIGSRKSKLALIQTNWVIDQLRKSSVQNVFTIKEISTKGDKNLNVSLPALGGGGVFLEELEHQLLQGDIDIAVHSLKDIPVKLPEGLIIASIPQREDHRDAYISKANTPFNELPQGAIIGTSSLRRAAQLLAQRPDIQTQWIRGPIDSRLKQLAEGPYDAIILAVAGIKRLGIGENVITEYLPENTYVPAVGQGALAIEARENDYEVLELLGLIHDKKTAKAVITERLFLNEFKDGDQAPIGGYAEVTSQNINLRGSVISLDGKIVLQATATGDKPELVAKEVADILIEQGALEVIQSALKANYFHD